MKDNFETALKTVLEQEGGFSNDEHDPGGATMHGIILSEYRRYRNDPTLTAEDLKRITDDEVRDIYSRNYWVPVCGDDLPSGVDLCVFDYAVNSGVGRASKCLQSAVGAEPDGEIGPLTLDLTRRADAAQTVNTIADERERFLQSLSTFKYFGRGWSRRVSEVRDLALKMT